MTRWAYALPLAALALLVVAFGIGLTRDPSVVPSAAVGKPVPAFALPGLAPGAPGFTSASLAGAPRVVNVFASWCAPCRLEHPLLLRLAAQGVAIHGIAWKDPPADAAAYLAREGNPFVATAADATGRTGIDLGVSGVPETFVLDRQGRVVFRHAGPLTDEAWASDIAPLLARLKAQR